MTPARLARALGLGVAVVVLVASGTYLLVYLYRWEWNRAQISGTFFLAALVILATTLVVSRLARLERRLDDAAGDRRRGPRWYGEPGAGEGGPDGGSVGGPEGSGSDDPLDTVRRAGARHAARHFEWLRQPPDRFGVFVPFLIGAGVIISVLAWVIERLAGLMASGTVDRRIAETLAPELPLGPGRRLGRAGSGGAPGGRPRASRMVVLAVLLAGLLTVTVLVVRETTQSRAEPEQAGMATTVELRVSQRGAPEPAEEVAEALAIACRAQLPRGAGVEVDGDEDTSEDDADPGDAEPAAQDVGPGGAEMVEATLVVDRGMGPQRRRRFFGCLQDTTLDRVTATVTGFDVAPAGS